MRMGIHLPCGAKINCKSFTGNKSRGKVQPNSRRWTGLAKCESPHGEQGGCFLVFVPPAVAHAVDGEEQFGFGGIAFHLLAKLHDVLVESAGSAEIVDAPSTVEEVIAGKDFPGTFAEK